MLLHFQEFSKTDMTGWKVLDRFREEAKKGTSVGRKQAFLDQTIVQTQSLNNRWILFRSFLEFFEGKLSIFVTIHHAEDLVHSLWEKEGRKGRRRWEREKGGHEDWVYARLSDNLSLRTHALLLHGLFRIPRTASERGFPSFERAGSLSGASSCVLGNSSNRAWIGTTPAVDVQRAHPISRHSIILL